MERFLAQAPRVERSLDYAIRAPLEMTEVPEQAEDKSIELMKTKLANQKNFHIRKILCIFAD